MARPIKITFERAHDVSVGGVDADAFFEVEELRKAGNEQQGCAEGQAAPSRAPLPNSAVSGVLYPSPRSTVSTYCSLSGPDGPTERRKWRSWL